MKPERINEVIAEHCGALTGWICPNCGHLEPEQVLYAEECESCLSPVVNRSPDYCNDLSAMADATDTLDDIQWNRFTDQLASITGGSDREMVCATAAQRAEAFVKSIKRWEEE